MPFISKIMPVKSDSFICSLVKMGQASRSKSSRWLNRWRKSSRVSGDFTRNFHSVITSVVRENIVVPVPYSTGIDGPVDTCLSKPFKMIVLMVFVLLQLVHDIRIYNYPCLWQLVSIPEERHKYLKNGFIVCKNYRNKIFFQTEE